jgi:hypothetical protein
MNNPMLSGEQIAKAVSVMRSLEWRMQSMWSNPITPEEAGKFSAHLMMSADTLEKALRQVQAEVVL